MNRLKTYDATGVAPNGRLFAGDMNALQDAVAALTDLTQNLSVASVAIGEGGLVLSRFGAGEAQITGAFRSSGIMRALGGLIYGAFTTAARNALTLPPFGLHILNTDNNRIEWNAGTAAVPSWQPVGAVPLAPNLLSNRPAASGVQSGIKFYATDQDVEYVASGSSWLRTGLHPGDLIHTLNSVADTGRIFYQGQAWPGTTGIYADLFAKIGGAFPTTLPDMRGRMLVTLGTHADVNAIALTDGLAVGSRRPKHQTSKTGSVTITGAPGIGSLAVTGAPGYSDPGHTHPIGTYNSAGGGEPGTSGNINPVGTNTGLGYIGITLNLGTLAVGGAPSIGSLAITNTMTFGPQTGSEPVDTVAYFVVQTEVKL